MPFDYQTLKNINSSAIIDGTLQTANFASRTIATGNIADGNVTAGTLAPSAVDLGGGATTGQMPVNRGGTALSTIGSNTQVLRTNSAANGFEYANVGPNSIQVFTSGGTWNRPAGVRYVRIKCQAAGGGGSGHGESGAAGGYSERVLEVAQNGINSVSVYVGGGGGGTYYANAGGNGDYAGFGPYASSQGGHGANRQNQHSGGVSGGAGGGDLNIHQGGGGSHHDTFGPGGTGHFGGPAPSGHPQGGNFAHNHQGHAAPGSGGTGAHYHGHRGADGRPGIVVIEEYR
jgi:hypothetical protein